MRHKIPVILIASGISLTLSWSLLAAPHAQERLFKGADVVAGKALYQEHKCSACHQERRGLNDQDYYTRTDRKVSSQEKLITQINFCSTQLGLTLFPEDELNIAAYLNETYYKLK